MADINNIKVLIFGSDWYNLEELQKMTDFERYFPYSLTVEQSMQWQG